jgi:hypothetical protein
MNKICLGQTCTAHMLEITNFAYNRLTHTTLYTELKLEQLCKLCQAAMRAAH